MAHTREELQGKSMDELHRMADDMGVDGHEEMDQNELMSALMEGGEGMSGGDGGGGMEEDEENY